MLIRNEQRFSPGKQPRLLVRSMVLYYLIAFSCILQPFLVQPVNAKLDFMTKLKLIGLIALGSKKVSIVPFPLPIPIPIHFEGKEEVIYVNAPSPYSSAYSYPKGPMNDYSGPSDYGHSMAASSGSYGVHPQHSSHKSKGYKSGPNSDYAAHASESMPVTTSFRYGDRLSAKPNGGPRPVPNRPNPNTVNHNRGYRNNRNYNYRPANNEISAPVIATSTTPASPPQYDYSSPYTTQIEQSQSQGQQQQSQQQDQSSNDQQQQSLRIALIPIKSLNLDNLGDQSTSQQHTQQQQQQQVNLYAPPGQNQQDNQLPENLVNYIRQVQNSLGQSGQEERPASEDQSGEQNQPSSQLEQNYSQVEYADPSTNSEQQQQQQQQQQYSSSTTTTQSSSSNQPEEPVTEQVVTQKPTQSNSFNSIPSQHFQTIQSNQFPEIPSTPQFSSFSSVQFPEIPNKSQHQSSQSSQSPQFPSIESSWQLNNYNPSAYVPQYKAPELKVIRTRYNPKQQQQEQFQFQNQKPDSFVTYSSNSNNAQPNSPQVHNSQFLYTVSHQSNPSVPYSFGQSHQIPSSYPMIDNFGLAQFQASQSKQRGHSKRSNLINPLMAASSFEVPTWITSPTSLFPKPARNPFRLRTRKHS